MRYIRTKYLEADNMQISPFTRKYHKRTLQFVDSAVNGVRRVGLFGPAFIDGPKMRQDPHK